MDGPTASGTIRVLSSFTVMTPGGLRVADLRGCGARSRQDRGHKSAQRSEEDSFSFCLQAELKYNQSGVERESGGHRSKLGLRQVWVKVTNRGSS